jgi:hypothetical protein
MPIQIEVIQRKLISPVYLKVEAEARYYEDATLNGVTDDEEKPKMPFLVGRVWSPVIKLETGKFVDWPQGVTADIHYKVCDQGRYLLLDADLNVLVEKDGYVPDILSPGGSGYGDYIIMKIDGTGQIENWSVDLDDFTRNDE